MSKWKVVSLGSHFPKVNALCVHPNEEGVVEMTWKGDLRDHPELKALLKQVSKYIGEQMPYMEGKDE